MSPDRRTAEGGFTLIEALVAIVILAFGLIGITNLFVIAMTSNSVANQQTGATSKAAEHMERLKATTFTSLPSPSSGSSVGSLNADSTSAGCGGGASGNDCFEYADVSGVGAIRTRWRITAIDGQLYFIEVRSEPASLGGGQSIGARRARVEFSTFRICAAAGCPSI